MSSQNSILVLSFTALGLGVCVLVHWARGKPMKDLFFDNTFVMSFTMVAAGLAVWSWKTFGVGAAIVPAAVLLFIGVCVLVSRAARTYRDVLQDLQNDTSQILRQTYSATAVLQRFLDMHSMITNNEQEDSTKGITNHNGGTEQLHIIYSHKTLDNEPGKHNREEVNRDSLLLPLVVDEAGLIMRIWAVATDCLGSNNVGIHCSCEFWKDDDENSADKDNPVVDKDHPVLAQNLVLVGSSKYNIVTKHVLDLAADKVPEVNFGFEEFRRGEDVRLVPLKAVGHFSATRNWPPTSLKKPMPDGGYVDYGLITRMTHPQEKERRVFVFAGCKSAAQGGIEMMLSNPSVVETLIRKYPADSTIECVIRVLYERDREEMRSILLAADKRRHEADITIVHPESVFGRGKVNIPRVS